MKYTWESEVRLNETDLQGIVNHANYVVYMAQARHKHLQSLGIDVGKVHEDGYDLVLVHIDLSFKAPLVCSDEFIVTSIIKPNGRIRINCEQEIIRKSDSKLIASAINTVTCLNIKTGRPEIPEFLQKILAKN